MIRINDKSRDGIYSSNMELIDNFTDYSSKNLDFDKPVEIDFLDDEENAKNPLGSTAHYNPDEMKITIYVTGRHLKDILRSISHELIHHVQNCRGDLDHGVNKLGYAQDDKHMRGMEHEAYTMGNIMNFRDFEDNYKRGTKTMSETKINKLKAMVREVLSEISVVGVSSKYKNMAMGSPEGAARYLVSQNVSDYVNEDEGLVVQNSVRKWLKAAKKDPTIAKRFVDAYYEQNGERPMNFRASFSGLSDVKVPDIDRKLADMEKIYKSAQSSAPAAGGTQAAGGTRSARGCVDKCPQGSVGETNQEYPGGVCKKDGRIVAVLNGQGNEAICKKLAGGGASPAGGRRRSGGGRRAYKNCDKEKVIRIRCKGKKVELIQKLLGISVDGKFWTGTRRAVKKFQRENNLTPDGAVGDKTFAALKARGGAAKKPGATPAGGAAQAGPTPSSGISDDLLFKIRTIANRQVQDALSRSAALRNVEAKNINKIRAKYREQIVKNVAQQFIDKKLKGKLQIQGAVKKLVFALENAETMDKEAANFAPRAANIKEGIEINFDEFTKTLNEHKNNKFDDRFKKLVKTFKK